MVIGQVIKTVEMNGVEIKIIYNGKNDRNEDSCIFTLSGKCTDDDFQDIFDLLGRLKNQIYENQEQGFDFDYRLDEIR